MDFSNFKSYQDIHGYRVYYEVYEDVKEGIQYLLFSCETSEATVFFEQARLQGKADFQDEWKRNFTLVYERGYHYLIKR